MRLLGFALDLDGHNGSGRSAIITQLGKVRDGDRRWKQTNRESWSRLEARGKPWSSVEDDSSNSCLYHGKERCFPTTLLDITTTID